VATNSSTETAVAAAPAKRERLIASAVQLLHRQGVEATTLAEIADAADVPVGNVYYYFKTKDDLVRAAIDAHVGAIATTLAEIEARHRTPRARLKGFVATVTAQRGLAAEYGCPHGTLCVELDKRGDELAAASTRLMQLSIEWVERQLRELGRRDAPELAVAMIAAYQGISLLTNAFRDPELMAREGRRLERWVDALASGAA
jgi:AcrR family transcriptional regulator